MAFDYINEAFKRLDLLEEQMFDTSLNGINELSDFMDNDNTEEIVRVIDPDADTDEQIQDSYVGKVIINCNVCHSHVFENKEEIKIEEDGAVNIDMQCPYCGEQEGFIIVGEIAPYGEPENKSEEDVTPPEEPVTETKSEEGLEEALRIGAEFDDEHEGKEDMNENKPLRMSRATKRAMQEDFKEVSITTDNQHMEMTSDENGKVTVTTEPVAEQPADEDMIVPVSDKTEEEILANNDIEETPVDDEVEVDFEEVDEEGLNDLGESYFRKVYENVNSFRTTSVAANSKALVVEGLITFASGAKKKTGFIFEAQDVNKRGQLRFRGSNKHLSESADAFSLVGRIDNKKLFVESLKYNYKVNEESVRGLVRRK